LINKLLMSGKGIGIRSLWDVKKDIVNKKLQLVLPESYFPSQGDVWVLSSPGRLQSEKVRNLYEYLVKELAKIF
jgi:DNA-binding transcriptional LysR family regulator